MIETIFGGLVSTGTCHLLTVLGEAGVGKSRLVSEVAGSLPSEAIVAHGRCLPYGEGITYWPLADIVREITRAAGGDSASNPWRRLQRSSRDTTRPNSSPSG